MDVKTGLLVAVIAILIGAAIISKREKTPSPPSLKLDQLSAKYEAQTACRERGIEYYKQIGSYPLLSSGEATVDVVIKKCEANPKLF